MKRWSGCSQEGGWTGCCRKVHQSLACMFCDSTAHYYDSTVQTAMQQHVVEHGEHDKAQQKSWSSTWSSTASGLSSRCPDTVLPLDQARSGRESEVHSARLSLTIIQFTAHVILISNTQSQQAHICKSFKIPVAMASSSR